MADLPPNSNSVWSSPDGELEELDSQDGLSYLDSSDDGHWQQDASDDDIDGGDDDANSPLVFHSDAYDPVDDSVPYHDYQQPGSPGDHAPGSDDDSDVESAGMGGEVDPFHNNPFNNNPLHNNPYNNLFHDHLFHDDPHELQPHVPQPAPAFNPRVPAFHPIPPFQYLPPFDQPLAPLNLPAFRSPAINLPAINLSGFNPAFNPAGFNPPALNLADFDLPPPAFHMPPPAFYQPAPRFPSLFTRADNQSQGRAQGESARNVGNGSSPYRRYALSPDSDDEPDILSQPRSAGGRAIAAIQRTGDTCVVASFLCP
ncbi:hypothetical protein Q8F55_004562 [Vanrija albida]|uniref:Uncharacterized protein n=1 Tax=Vanrija albida TaxID=181172 RepID=A0ABR3Q741_9TREE